MDDATEQSRLLDRVVARIMPELQLKIGEAYLRGWPYFISCDEDGMKAEAIPADQFYIGPDGPAD